MKRLPLIISLVLLFYQGFSWGPYGPTNIVATNICFGPYENYDYPKMICTNNGMYLSSDYSGQWNFYSIDGLPVQECVFPDFETIILVTGNGTTSDGIYNFDIDNEQFLLLAYCDSPHFIKYDDYAEKYYVGYANGLLVSDNGITWEDVPYFSGLTCIEMAKNYTYLAVSTDQPSANVVWSTNSGVLWNSSANYVFISQMAFYGNDLYGVFPGTSYSSGLYKSTDFGNTWEVEFWSTYISDVCYDDYDSELFVCWDNPDAGYEGIAIYDGSGSTSGLTFFNDGLTNTNINKISYRPVIDAFFTFVCTNTGVYSYVFVGVDESSIQNKISIFPNPVGLKCKSV